MITKINIGLPEALKFEHTAHGLDVTLPEVLPGGNAFALKIEGVIV